MAETDDVSESKQRLVYYLLVINTHSYVLGVAGCASLDGEERGINYIITEVASIY